MGMRKYDDPAIADLGFAEALKHAKHPTEFCPLINTQCNPRCVCFKEPTMHEFKVDKAFVVDEKQWAVYEHYCNNAMFFRE